MPNNYTFYSTQQFFLKDLFVILDIKVQGGPFALEAKNGKFDSYYIDHNTLHLLLSGIFLTSSAVVF